MNHTAFPITPRDVATLSIQEFTFDLDDVDRDRVPSMERVCRTFMDDANRALVWWIRFGALKNWYATNDALEGSTSTCWMLRDAWEVAASFPLNHLWEFDPTAFAFAVESVAKRQRGEAPRASHQSSSGSSGFATVGPSAASS